MWFKESVTWLAKESKARSAFELFPEFGFSTIGFCS